MLKIVKVYNKNLQYALWRLNCANMQMELLNEYNEI